MKTYCPNCENETECIVVAEVHKCAECHEEFERAATSSYVASLEAEVTRLKRELLECEDPVLSLLGIGNKPRRLNCFDEAPQVITNDDFEHMKQTL